MKDINDFFIGARRKDTTIPDRSLDEETFSDRSRVLFSAPFRRLQQKAQVFSLEKNAAVRSRLTHTLEVSDCGRQMAQNISDILVEKGVLKKNNSRAFVNIVEVSCFMHDIGNLPFGHFGEEAIKRWFNKKGEQIFKYSKLDYPKEGSIEYVYLSDFTEFDGNPQGFRIMTHLQNKPGPFLPFGLNLLNTQLGAFLKYTRHAGCKKEGSHVKKAGYFNTEKYIVEEITSSIGYEGRHPLVYIMEAADDISYCLSDIEDGIEKNIISAVQFLKEIKKDVLALKLGIDLKEYFDLDESTSTEDFFNFKITVNRYLKDYCVNKYCEDIEKYTDDTKECLIHEDTNEGKLLEIIKSVAKKLLFTSEEAQNIELSGYNIINGLLEEFTPLLEISREEFDIIIGGAKKKGLDVERRLFAKLPGKYIEAYIYCRGNNRDGLDPVFLEFHSRIHLILDFITGMTDNYSLMLHKQLKGIDI